MLGDDLSVWDFLSSMTFPENFIFPGFPDPVGTLSMYISFELKWNIFLRHLSVTYNK